MQSDISYWHTTAKDRNNWLETIFSWWKDSSVLIIFATAVFLLIQWRQTIFLTSMLKPQKTS